jgi:rubrerythrin
MKVPSWSDTGRLDDFFVAGRRMWPDLADIRRLRFNREVVPDEVVRFIRSTALNEYGIVHYVKGYFRSYGDDYKLGVWAAVWGGEEYLHSIVLHSLLEGLGERISDAEYAGLEMGDYAENVERYLEDKRAGTAISRRTQQLIYGVIQEYSAVIAYSSVADVAGDPALARILRRIAKDEMRHCRFFQLSLEALAQNIDDREFSEIWGMFNALFKDHEMPQDQIAMFQEFDMGTDLYIKFWTPQYRSNLILFLTHYFRKFRSGRAALRAAPTDADAMAETAA